MQSLLRILKYTYYEHDVFGIEGNLNFPFTKNVQKPTVFFIGSFLIFITATL